MNKKCIPKISIQRQSHLPHIPTNQHLLQWAKTALQKKFNSAQITIRIVNKKESAALNQKTRHKSGPTNVLSFDYEHNPVIGDIVLCAGLIKSKHQWAHLTIHGILHLMGHDHMNENEASQMEKIEIFCLKKLGFPNPYQNL